MRSSVAAGRGSGPTPARSRPAARAAAPRLWRKARRSVGGMAPKLGAARGVGERGILPHHGPTLRPAFHRVARPERRARLLRARRPRHGERRARRGHARRPRQLQRRLRARASPRQRQRLRDAGAPDARLQRRPAARDPLAAAVTEHVAVPSAPGREDARRHHADGCGGSVDDAAHRPCRRRPHGDRPGVRAPHRRHHPRHHADAPGPTPGRAARPPPLEHNRAGTRQRAAPSPVGGYEALYVTQQSAAIRRAIVYALARPRLAEAAWRGTAEPAQLLGPAVLLGRSAELVGGARFDPRRARRVLDGAGWTPLPDGTRAKAGRRLALTLVIGPPDFDIHRVMATVVQDQLREAGIDLRIVPLPESGAYQARIKSGAGDLWTVAGELSDADPCVVADLAVRGAARRFLDACRAAAALEDAQRSAARQASRK